MGLVQKAFSDIITFSRSSNATRIGPNGLVQYAPHNLVLQSQTLDNASWTKSSVTVTANSISAPDGTVTADTVDDTDAAAAGAAYQDVSVAADTSTYTVSCYFKKGTTNVVALRASIFGGTGIGASFAIDLNNGNYTASISLTAAPTSVSVTSVGNGWYRCALTFSNNGTAGNTTMRVYVFPAYASALSTPVNSLSTTTPVDNTVTGYAYAWGFQVSKGSIAGDYVPTTSAAVYGPRFDYDPVTLAAKGLLIEEQRTNLLTYSEQFDNAAWAKTRLSVTANAIAAPDGTVTADKLIEDSTASDTHTISQSATIVSGQLHAISFYAKASERSWIAVQATSGFGTNSVYFNVANGTVGTIAGSGSATITSAGNGWYRCSFFPTVSTGTTAQIIIYIANGNGGAAYTGDGTSGIYIWGAQLEAGSFATSYIPTLASSVTRSADVASVNTLSPWFNATEGTLFAEVIRDAVVTSAGLSASINDGTTSNRLRMYHDTATSYVGDVNSGGAGQASLSATITAGANIKAAMAYKVNDFAMSVNGGSPSTDTAGSLPTGLTTLSLGNNITGNYLSGWLKRLAYYPRRLTNAELQSITS